MPADKTIFTPADPNWDEVRKAWNLAVGQRPAARKLAQVRVPDEFSTSARFISAADDLGKMFQPMRDLEAECLANRDLPLARKLNTLTCRPSATGCTTTPAAPRLTPSRNPAYQTAQAPERPGQRRSQGDRAASRAVRSAVHVRRPASPATVKRQPLIASG